MPTPPVEAVVFDLGGVLADVAGVARMRALAAVESDEQVWHRWLTCDWVRRFERGWCAQHDFAAGVVAEWELAVTPEEFLAEFRGWLVGPLPGATELVVEVRRQVPVALLSSSSVWSNPTQRCSSTLCRTSAIRRVVCCSSTTTTSTSRRPGPPVCRHSGCAASRRPGPPSARRVCCCDRCVPGRVGCPARAAVSRFGSCAFRRRPLSCRR